MNNGRPGYDKMNTHNRMQTHSYDSMNCLSWDCRIVKVLEEMFHEKKNQNMYRYTWGNGEC